MRASGQKQAEWRTDPARSGPGGAIGDIGTHAFHLLEYVSGLEVTAINATLRSVVAGRRLDDDCNAFVRMNNGAAGMLACSQVAAGEMNELRLRIYGEERSLEWRQQDPNRLTVKGLDKPEEIHHAATSYLSGDAKSGGAHAGGASGGVSRGLRSALREFADALINWKQGVADPLPVTLPGIRAGVRGMRFMARAIESNRREGWVEF